MTIPEGYRIVTQKVTAKSGKVYEYIYLAPDRRPQIDVETQGKIVGLRQQGQTLQAIGEKMGISKQRVDQILKRFYKNLNSH